MMTEQMTLAEKIEAVQRALKLIRNIETPFTARDKEALDAAAATLQQHERAMAVVEALIESRRLAVKARQYNAPSSDVAALLLAEETLNGALAALDDAASAAATPVGKGDPNVK